MATTFVEYTGDGQASKQFTFPSYQESDVKVRVDGVLKTTSTHYNITNYTTTGGGNVVFTSGNIPSSPANIRIYRDTNVDTAKATFTAGSSVKAADLNNNTTQLLYRAQEEQIPNLIHSYDIDDGAIETSKIKADAITGAKIADDQINSEHYVDGSIDTAHIADSQITSAKIADGTIVNADINASAAIAGSKIAASTTSAAGTMSAADKTKLDGIESGATADQTAAEIRTLVESATDSNVFTDADHTKLNGIETGATADQTNAEIRAAVEAATDSNVFTDADHSKLNAIEAGATADQTASEIKTLLQSDKLTANEIASNAVTTDKIADGELTTLAGMQSTTASNLASSTALTATTAELNQLDGITLETSVTTNSDTRIPTSKAVNDLVLSVTNALGGFVAIANETSFPTSNPDPSNNAGTVVSISQLSTGLAVNSSGVATISNGAGSGNTVTITGFPANLQSQTLPASSGLQVQTTSTLHTYTFHKQLASAADIQAISATVNSFSNRYRVSASAPTSSLDGGDLWYDTTNSKLMVYSSQNSAWEESSAIGNFFISTISSSSNTGGGSATPNGTAYRFTISDAPTNAAQLIVSVDGVIQKPNSGSSAPSEGFVLVGNDIIFGAAPANGASLFVTVIGSTVGIGTPSNNTVTTAILQNGSVTTAKITDANVTTAKIADDAVTAAKLADTSVTAGSYGSSTSIPSITVDAQGRITAASGNTVNTDLVGDTSPQLGGDLDINNYNVLFADSTNANNDRLKFGAGEDLSIYHNGNHSFIEESGTGSLKVLSSNIQLLNAAGNETMIQGTQNGAVELYHDNSKKFETYTNGIKYHGHQIGQVNGSYFQWQGANSNAFAVGMTSGADSPTGSDNHLQFHHWNNSSWDKVFFVHRDYINIPDGKYIGYGNSNDLQIYHDGTTSYIKNTTGDLVIRDDTIHLKAVSTGDTYLSASNGGAVSLRYDNSTKFETNNEGVRVNGILELHDNNRIQIGDGDDFQIYHDGTSNIILADSGDLNIRMNNSENAIVARQNGAAELYYDNGIKFQTTSSGAQVSGTLRCNISNADAVYVDEGSNLKFCTGAATSSTASTGTVSFDARTYDGNKAMLHKWTAANIDGASYGQYSEAWYDGGSYRHITSTSSGFKFDNHLIPSANNSLDLGTSSLRWRNVYTNDLHLSNQDSSNDVDGTWGDWTIQEGESDLFLKNNRSGKKYKFNLTEVS